MRFETYYKTTALGFMYSLNKIFEGHGKEIAVIEEQGTRRNKVTIRVETECGRYWEQLCETDWVGAMHYLKGMADFAYALDLDEV